MSFDALMSITPPAGTLARPSINGAAPVLQSTVTAANSAVINGIAISTGVERLRRDGITAFTVVNTSISSSGGTAISVTSATPSGMATFTSVSSSGTAAGISLTTAGGTWSFGTGALNGTGTSVHVSGGTAAITYDGTISQSTAGVRPVNIVNAGGSATFNGNITASGTANGINLDNNDAATITFRGGLSLTTGANVGFNAVNGATAVVVCATTLCGGGSAVVNTIATTTGTALNVNATTIGGSGLTFRSISANGGANGIVLIGTGAGGLTVTGDGTNTALGGNGTGGTLANMSGANGAVAGSGIYLDNVSNIVLRRLTINGTNQNFGIRGFRVSNLTLEYMTVGGANGNDLAFDNYGEGSVMFGDDASVATNGLTGAATVTSSLFSGGASKDFSIVNTAGSLNRITITGSTFGLTQNLLGGQNLLLEARNAGTIMNATVTGTSFLGAPSGNSNFTGQTGTTMDVVYDNNVLTNTHAQNIIGSTSLTLATQGVMTFSANNNTMRGANGSAVTLQKASAGTLLSGTSTATPSV